MNLKPRVQRIALAGGLFFILSTAHLFTPGQFMDGATYAAVSRNLAQGLGSTWDLWYTPELYARFVEHPPLHFWVQSSLFHLWGDQWWVEDIYAILIWLLTALGIDRLGRWSGLSQRAIQWSLLLWTAIPIVTWTYGNNLLETTLSASMVWASATMIYGLRRNQWGYLFLGGLWIAAGALTKGPVALFPLAVPFWWHIAGNTLHAPIRRIALDSTTVLAGLLLPWLILWNLSEPHAYLSAYWSKQVVHSLEAIQTVSSRWYILGSFAMQMLIPAIIALGVRRFRPLSEGPWRLSPRSIAFAFIALSAVLPIMISLKQRDFYAVPAYPFAALALASFLDGHRKTGKTIHPRILWQWTLGLWALGFALRTLPEVHMSKDFTLRQSIYQAAKTHRGQTLYAADSLLQNWNLIAQCARVGEMYLKAETADSLAPGPRLIYKEGRVFVFED